MKTNKEYNRIKKEIEILFCDFKQYRSYVHELIEKYHIQIDEKDKQIKNLEDRLK